MNDIFELNLSAPQIHDSYRFWGNIYNGDLNEATLVGWVKQNSSNIPRALQNQNGEYAFVVALEGQNYAIAARDQIGIMPLYIYHFGQGRFLLSSQMGPLVRRADKLTINKDYMAAIMDSDFSLVTDSPYMQITRCPPGHYAILHKDKGVTFERYWDATHLCMVKTTDEISDWLEQGRTLIKNICSERWNVHSRISCFLSGGLDSSYLALKLEKSAHNIHGLLASSLIFANGKNEDKKSLEIVNANLKCRKNMIECDQKLMLEFEDNDENLWGTLFYDPCLWLFRPLLSKAQSDASEIVVTGLGGDDVFQPGLNYLSRFSILSEFKTILRQLRNPHTDLSLIRGILRHVLRPRVKSVLMLDNNLDPEAQMLAQRFLQGGAYAFAIEQEQELAQSYGVRMSYPYLDVRVMKYVLASPRAIYLNPTMDKNLLRLLASEIVPDFVTKRSSTQDYNLLRSDIVTRQKPSWSVDQPDSSSYCRSKIFGPEGQVQEYFDSILKSRYNANCIKQVDLKGRNEKSERHQKENS